MAERQPSIEERISASLAPEPAPEPVAEAPVETPQLEAVETEKPTEKQIEQAEQPEQAEESLQEDATVETAEIAETAEEEALEVSSISDLAEHLGVETADLYNVSIPITDANGERKEVSLGEWKDTFQNNERAQRLAQESEALKAELQTQQQQAAEAMEKQAQEGAMFINQVQQTLQAEFQSVDWDSLRVQNPTEWTAKRQEFQERNGKLQAMRQQAAQAYDQNKVAISEQHQKELGQVIEREDRALTAALPSWQNNETRQAEQAELVNYLLDQGYSQQDVDSSYDHRTIVLAHKAMMYDKSMRKTDVTKKKVLKLGSKVLRPGAKRSKAQQQSSAESALKSSLKKSGSIDDATALIQHRLSNNRR